MTDKIEQGEDEPVAWQAVLDAEQLPRQLNHDLHVVTFRKYKSAEYWVEDQMTFKGWRYHMEPLYTRPQPAPASPSTEDIREEFEKQYEEEGADRYPVGHKFEGLYTDSVLQLSWQAWASAARKYVGICQPAPVAVPDGWRTAVSRAYAWLWHVNNEPMAPIALWSAEQAAYKARRELRDIMTHEERGKAINALQAEFEQAAGAPKAYNDTATGDEILQNFVASQKPLEPEFAKVLHDNLCDLTSTDTGEPDPRDARIAELEAQQQMLVDALQELVSCKELNDKADALHFCGPNGTPINENWESEWKQLQAEYIRRKPLAWDSARKALPLEELGKLVAERLHNRSGGWKTEPSELNGAWVDATGRGRKSPAHPAEYLPLCAEFGLWPVSEYCGNVERKRHVVILYGTSIIVEHDNTPASIEDAAHRALLIGILMTTEGK